MSDVWQALAHPVRREILALLRGGAMTAGEIGAHFTCSGATLSGHLKALREAGLATMEPDGNRRVYRINLSVAEEALAGLLDMLRVGSPRAYSPPAPRVSREDIP